MARTPDAQVRAAAVSDAADLLKLMANPNRLAILCRLVEGETSVGEMESTLGIRQPTLSQQLGELRKAGLVSDRRAAKVVFYRLSDDRARLIVRHVHDLFCDPQRVATSSAAGRVVAEDPAVEAGKATGAHAAVFGRILADHA